MHYLLPVTCFASVATLLPLHLCLPLAATGGGKDNMCRRGPDSNHSSCPGDQAGRRDCCLVAKSCPSLCNPVDCSPPGSSVRGISQARTLEWVAISFSRGSSQLRDLNLRLLHWQDCFTAESPGTPPEETEGKAGIFMECLVCVRACVGLFAYMTSRRMFTRKCFLISS